jgi:hypothetical protein
MKKSTFLSQLAAAGIAAGLVAAPGFTEETKKAAEPVAKEAKAKADGKDASCKAKGECKGHEKKADGKEASCKAKGECKGHEVKADSAAKSGVKGELKGDAKAAPAVEKKAAACKGHNDCKGKGGCGMTDKDIEAAAKKMGIAKDKAGKAHGCKGMNECKGLGGCKM